ncbi:hypothetical protein SSX86_003070 [Deinandra increscens subsp. villosa]|uniref:DUF7787 domain-containing protein n=1 Tax=Deinandra increscens subsp. villosa TaxID=3103831 RepID=A0AAP0DL55_9ASTR
MFENWETNSSNRFHYLSDFVRLTAMASQGASGKPLQPKLTLENYLNLEHMDVISALTLRKILTMHGFNSVNVPKVDLIDAVRSIELMDAHHSTLQSDVSSNAFLSLNDVIKDISLLNWHECCITSLETINPVNDFGDSEVGEEEPSPKRLKPICNMASDTALANSSQKMAESDDPVTGGRGRRISKTPARYDD